MSEKSQSLEQMLFTPRQIMIFMGAVLVGLAGGLIYSLFKGSILGFVLDAVLAGALVAAWFVSKNRKFRWFGPLAVCTLGTMLIFYTDVVTSLLLEQPIPTSKLILDILILTVVNVVGALLLHPAVSLVSGLLCCAAYLFLALLPGNGFYLGYSCFVLPALAGITLWMFHSRKVLEKVLASRQSGNS